MQIESKEKEKPGHHTLFIWSRSFVHFTDLIRHFQELHDTTSKQDNTQYVCSKWKQSNCLSRCEMNS